MHSTLMVELKASAAALSSADPTRPLDWITPSRWHAVSNASAVYGEAGHQRLALVDPVGGQGGRAQADRRVADLAMFGLEPHLVDTWKLSTDPLFIDKVRDIVGCTWRRTGRWCSRWTRSPRFKRWTVPRRCDR
jgi:hypothetical protein